MMTRDYNLLMLTKIFKNSVSPTDKAMFFVVQIETRLTIKFHFADGCGENTTEKKNLHRKDAASIPKRRVSDGNDPFSSDFIPRSRPSSFNDGELSTVPEVTISQDEECNDSEDSSRSPSPNSRVGFIFNFRVTLDVLFFFNQ